MAAPVLSHLRPWWLPFQLLPRIAARNRKNTPVPARGLTPWPDSKLPAFSHVPTASSTSLSLTRSASPNNNSITFSLPFSLSFSKPRSLPSPLSFSKPGSKPRVISSLSLSLSLSRPTPRLLGSQQATSPSFSRARLLRAPPRRAPQRASASAFVRLQQVPTPSRPRTAAEVPSASAFLHLLQVPTPSQPRTTAEVPSASAFVHLLQVPTPSRPRTAAEVPSASAFVRLLQVPSTPRPCTAAEPPSATVPCFERKALSQLHSSQPRAPSQPREAPGIQLHLGFVPDASSGSRGVEAEDSCLTWHASASIHAPPRTSPDEGLEEIIRHVLFGYLS